MSNSDKSRQSLRQLILAYLFAGWHMRQMPRRTQKERLRRAAWARDHAAAFAGRWFIIALLAWLLHMSPLGAMFTVAGVPVLVILFPVALIIGLLHLLLQILGQQRAGPPRIDPPEDWPDDPRD